jgi:hypothetical protein
MVLDDLNLNLECYRCLHDPSNENGPLCAVEFKSGKLFSILADGPNSRSTKHNLWSDDDDEDVEDFEDDDGVIRIGESVLQEEDLKVNPCILVASSVIDLMDQEHQSFYNNIDAISSPGKILVTALL